jgi:hypothetical protein
MKVKHDLSKSRMSTLRRTGQALPVDFRHGNVKGPTRILAEKEKVIDIQWKCASLTFKIAAAKWLVIIKKFPIHWDPLWVRCRMMALDPMHDNEP